MDLLFGDDRNDAAVALPLVLRQALERAPVALIGGSRSPLTKSLAVVAHSLGLPQVAPLAPMLKRWVAHRIVSFELCSLHLSCSSAVVLAQIAWESTSSDLSDKSAYPGFSRLIPDDATQAKAMFALAVKLGWRTATVVRCTCACAIWL